MKLLAIETATTCLSVAVLDGERVLARTDLAAPGQHAKYLVPAIDDLFRSSGLTLSKLDGVAVSSGPGSFTGLRVGLATAIGFRMAAGLPLAMVPSLEAMAWNLRGAHQPLCPIFKSRTGEVYWALYQWTASGMLQCLAGEQVGSPVMMAESLNGRAVVFGEGWEANTKELRRMFEKRNQRVDEAPPEANRASAVSVGLAGHERLVRGDIAGQGISPRYVQRAEAELMMERRAGRSGP
ncbi:MAG: tRNA (adenosine(37)-N6)-threonylcarbamoyltransferase complex dimerization subunit type 1 TsaB [Nitrospiraceae bacterium]